MRSFFLTDFLARTFAHTVIRELGLDRYPELRDDYFRHYTRVLWLAQRYLASQSRFPSALVVHGLNPLLAIGLALFALARAERSRALLVFAAANLAAVLANSYDIDGLLRDHGLAVSLPWTFVPRLWAAAAVLLLAGAAFAIAGRQRR